MHIKSTLFYSKTVKYIFCSIIQPCENCLCRYALMKITLCRNFLTFCNLKWLDFPHVFGNNFENNDLSHNGRLKLRILKCICMQITPAKFNPKYFMLLLTLNKKLITHVPIYAVILKLKFNYIKIEYSVSVKSTKSL